MNIVKNKNMENKKKELFININENKRMDPHFQQ